MNSQGATLAPASASRMPLLAWLFPSGMAALAVLATPLGGHSQLVASGALLSAAVALYYLPGDLPRVLLMSLSLLATARYAWWRCTGAWPVEWAWYAWVGFALLLAEAYTWVTTLLGFLQTVMPLQRPAVALPPDASRWPSVDVYIPTYNEPLSVLKPAVLAALCIDWPHGKLKVFVLDDGHRPEIRAFAEAAGACYLSRSDNHHAKAGNLNHALQHTDGEFIAIFDCDHVPVRSFLQVTLGWLVADSRCALVQTPHHFFSPDPFERNLRAFRYNPNEGKLFYGLIQRGNDLWNASFFCGSCAVLRRSALLEIGGIAVETVTEDAHTALKLHRLGYRSVYLDVILAAGLATEDLRSHVGQRMRWARGMTQLLRLDNPLAGPGLSLAQRLCYANAMLYFFFGLPRLIFILAPLVPLYFNAPVIQAKAQTIALYVAPHFALSLMCGARLQGNRRHTFWSEIFETALAWHLALVTFATLFNPRGGKFNVTPKGGLVYRDRHDWALVKYYAVGAVLTAAGIAAGVLTLAAHRPGEAFSVLLSMAWAAWNLALLGAAIGAAHESRQRRRHPRVQGDQAAFLLWDDGRTLRCRIIDFSSGGLGVALEIDVALSPGERVDVCIDFGSGEHVLHTRVVWIGRRRAGLAFRSSGIEHDIAAVQCTFARADAWIDWDAGIQRLGIRDSAHAVLHRAGRAYLDLGAACWRQLRRRCACSWWCWRRRRARRASALRMGRR
jgi:cellulose synthase (UDP-forming)